MATSDDRQAALELMLDRYEQPLYRATLPVPPALSASGTNPRCGDTVTMYARVDRGSAARVTFTGGGCTISQASADLTAELCEGRSVADIAALEPAAVLSLLGPGTVETRLDCALLALRTLQRALATAIG